MMVKPTLDNTWGAALVGLVVASMLYGMTTLQAYMYYVKYPNDIRAIKLLVLTVWILDTVSLCLVFNAMYGYLVSDMFQPFHLLVINRTLNVDPAIMGILAFLTHSYLGIRVWKVCNRNKILAVVLAILSLTALGLALAASIVSFRFKLWKEKTALKSLALAGTILVVILDAAIATVLCIYLHKQKTQQRDLRRIIHRVSMYAINTGLASSILSTINVVTFVAFPDTMIFLGSNFIFTKVYANCLLANLNVRESLNRPEPGAPSLNLSALRDPTISAIVYNEAENSQRPSIDDTISPDHSKDELCTHEATNV